MVNNIFVDNSAKVGGAVYALRAPSVVAANSFFMNNTATHRGGAIAVKDYDYNNSTLDPLSPSPFPVSIGGSVFVRNTAMFQGEHESLKCRYQIHRRHKTDPQD